MPVYLSVFEGDTDLVAVFAFLAECDCKGIRERCDDVWFDFAFAFENIHSVDLLFNRIENDWVR